MDAIELFWMSVIFRVGLGLSWTGFWGFAMLWALKLVGEDVWWKPIISKLYYTAITLIYLLVVGVGWYLLFWQWKF